MEKSRKFKEILLVFIFISVTVVSINALHDKTQFSDGKRFRYNWAILLSISIVGIVLNGTSIHLLLTEVDSSRMSMYNYLLALNTIDFLFGSFEFIANSLNLSADTIFGGELQCQITSSLVIMFYFWSVTIISLISYATERRLCVNIKLSNFQIFYFIILGGMYSAFVGFGSVYLPNAGYYLEPSGNSHVSIYFT